MAKTVDLDREVAQYGNFEEKMNLARLNFINRVQTLFIWTNGFVLALIVLVLLVESIAIWNGILPAKDRSINTRVIIALIAATTVQVGSLMAVIAGFLFRDRKAAKTPRAINLG